MAPTTSILVLLASAISMISAAPVAEIQSRQQPATLNFVPYAGPCEMSTNPFDTQKPTPYNLTTSSGCITPPYAFSSYAGSANTAATSDSCALNIFTGTGCTGTVFVGKFPQSAGGCVFVDQESAFFDGQSVLFDCEA